MPPQRWCPQEDRQWRLDSPLYCMMRSFGVLFIGREVLKSIFLSPPQGGPTLSVRSTSPRCSLPTFSPWSPSSCNMSPMRDTSRYTHPRENGHSTLRVLLSLEKNYEDLILFIPNGNMTVWGNKAFILTWITSFSLSTSRLIFYQTFTPGTSASAYNGCAEGMSCIPQQQYQQQWCVLFDRQNNYIHGDLKDCVWLCAAALPGEFGSCCSVFFSETQTSVVQPPAVLQIS